MCLIPAECKIMMFSTLFQWEVEGFFWHRCYFLVEGWDNFITENKVVVGDTIILEYKGDGLFTADIYASYGLIKHAPRLPSNCFNYI